MQCRTNDFNNTETSSGIAYNVCLNKRVMITR
jgi:hypothetical protein